MSATLLDTDTLTFLHKRQPQVALNAASHVRRFGHLIFSEFSYYEVTSGFKSIGATSQLSRFEESAGLI